MRWAPTNLTSRAGHRFRLSTPPPASALTAYPPVAAALAEEQLPGWLRIAPAGLQVAAVLRGSTPATAPGSAAQERRARRLILTA